MEIFEEKFNVELCDINSSFGLKSSSVLKYYQETFARYCAKHNVAGYDVFKMGLKWVLGETIVEYENIIPVWNEKVVAKVWISSVKKLRMYFDFIIETQRGVVAKGQSVAYVLDLENSRPQPVDMIVKHFNIDVNELENNVKKLQFESINNVIASQEHIITFSDLDYNSHTNNISYLVFAIEGMSEAYVKENYLKTLDIKYLQETFLNDVLRCDISKNGDNFEYKIINKKDESLVCLINATWQKNLMSTDKFYEIIEQVR